MIFWENMRVDSESYRLGEELFRRGSVHPAQEREDTLCYDVGSTPPQRVSLFASGAAQCTCGQEQEPCCHVAAAVLAARGDGRLRRFRQESEMRLGEKMLGVLSRAMPGGETVRLAPVLRLYGDGRAALGLNVGQERLYAVRSVADLLTCFALGAPLKMSGKFTYRPDVMRFSREDERLLTLLMNHIPLRAETLRQWEEGGAPAEGRLQGPPTDGRFVLMTGALLHGVLRYFENHSFWLLINEEKIMHGDIRTVELPLCFAIALTPTELTVRAEGVESLRLVSPDARYVLWEGRVTHLHSAQARVCRLLCQEGPQFCYPARQAEDTLATLLPALSAVGAVAPSPELAQRLETAPLKAAAYLDLIGGNVEARVEFHYGDALIDPFAASRGDQTALPEGGRLLLRDGRAESALLNFFSDAGFVVRGGHIVLKRSKEILKFCTQGVTELARLCEVYASTAFEKVKPRRFAARASFHMRGGRLVFELLEEGKPVPELLPVMRAIAQRQQYVRLKTGEFLDVRDMSALAPVVQELLDAASLDDPGAGDEAREISFGAYRSAYMVSMLRMAGAEVEADGGVENAIGALGGDAQADLGYVPGRLRRKLTPYQQRGCAWVLSLYEARMGGILADEMGLGKTVQIIAALSAARRRDGVMKSMIVTPTSLTYHWLAEFKRFDESMVVRVVTGPREERRRAIEEIKHDPSVDVVLTSYPLLRRDIEHLRDIPLRFAILDEAQSVKNAQSQGAVAAKELDAQVRVALTGTPMENHTGELWSIFDFVLPGYLGTQAAFLRRYGGGERADELRERIRPFLMRRLKSEVLADLPKKREE